MTPWENGDAPGFYEKAKQYCNGKQCYDKKTAQTLRNARGNHGTLLRIYQCDLCDSWHLTKSLDNFKKKYVKPQKNYK